MRVKLVPVLLSLLLTTAACGGGGGSGNPAGPGSNVDNPQSGLGSTVPACPFDAAKASQIVGQPLVDQGSCLFGDGKGVASLNITTSTELAGSTTYDYSHKQAGKTYTKVVDVQKGDRAYIAVKKLQAEAVLISKKGSYTMIMSNFEFDLAKYEQTLRALLDAIPA